MGNREHSRKQDDFNQMLISMRKEQHRKVNVNPQKKYLVLMVEELEKAKIPIQLKEMVAETLRQKLTQVQLIECISCISALKNNEFQVNPNRSSSFLREKPESKFVKINFGEGFLKKIISKFPLNFNFLDQNEDNISDRSADQWNCPPSPVISHQGRSRPSENKHKHEQNEIKQKLKSIVLVIRKQLNRISHPFGKLNKSFAQFIEQNNHQFLLKNKSQQSYEKALRLLLTEWCIYLEGSVLSPYRKWIISYTGIQEQKYGKWIRGLIMQQIFAVNNGYLFSMLAIVINRRKTKLEVDINQLQYSASLLTPSLFNIDSKLQIQGHFFDSIYEMSEVVSKSRPEQILLQLETVKKRICTDIDNYHRLVERGQMYQIDSDNILGIVSYILCKIASKIDEIHTHLIFLRIIYGDGVYFTMGVSSYMLSTIFGALEFLESPDFRKLLDVKEDHNIISIDDEKGGPNNHSQTKGTLSQKQQTDDKGEIHQQKQEKRAGSLVLTGQQNI